jgi:signal transduction histidine kinase
MRGYLSMLPLAGELNERQHDATQKIAGGIDSISDLTERLLYLSRLQFGEEAQLELSLVDVETLVKQIVIEQEQNVHQREVTVRLEAEEKLPLLPADEMLYRQAIANLVNNAVKYSPDAGEVVVRVFKSEEGGASQMTVAVTDTGMGIREEDQPRLFEAFYRVPQREGEPPRPRGSGLGLALVKAIAITHGGTVGVQSTLGGGSTFHITLPIRSFNELE